jgi:SAM-dependent methyltransferase
LLDVGCGSGALTVLIKLLGYDAVGFDVDEAQVELARTLAEENGFSPDMFICGQSTTLPFADASFGLITMISAVEHIDDATLNALAPELARICKGALFVQAPSSAAVRDDHTGLLFVPWMPRWLAKHYISSRGSKYRYLISKSGTWDVYYRTFEQLISYFEPYFDWRLAPADCSYPQTPDDYVPTRVGKRLRISGREVFVGLPLPWRQFRVSRGYPKEAYFPYMNLIFTPKNQLR